MHITKKNMKIIFIFMIVLIVFMVAMGTVVKASIDPGKYKGVINGEDSYKLLRAGRTITGLIQWIGSAIAVGALIIIGVKYIIESPEGKADLKTRLLPFLVGAILLFAASNLVGIVANFANSNLNT